MPVLLRYLPPLFFPGVIPVTSSELTAVNFPSFHVTPLKLMVSPTSVAAVPVGNSPALTSSHPVPVQNPSSAIVNFTLQHLGLLSPSVQVSASPGAITVSPRIEAVSVISDNAGTQQGRATRYDSPVPGQNQPNGQSVAVMGTQQVRAFPFNGLFSPLGLLRPKYQYHGRLAFASLPWRGKGWEEEEEEEETEGLTAFQTLEKYPRSTQSSRPIAEDASFLLYALPFQVWPPKLVGHTYLCRLDIFFLFSLSDQPVPVTPKGSQSVAESFFRTPGGPGKPTGPSCVDFDGANKTSVGTLFVPQRKLEVSTEDVH